VFVDCSLDASFLIRRRVIEIGLETTRDQEARIIEPSEEKLLDFVIVEPDP